MTLNKRYRRDIKHNLSLFVSATFLTVLSLFLFYLYYICGTGILDYSDEIFSKYQVEDANFSTYVEIPDDKLAYYEDKYNLTLEKQAYLNLETNGITSRIFDRATKVDLHFIIDGRDVQNDDEIIISKGFAIQNNYALNDKIKIVDKEYTIVGYCERPDYMVMLQDPSDLDKNIVSFYIAYMSDEAFETLGQGTYQYLVRYNLDNSIEFRQDVNDAYLMRSYLNAEDNLRINMMTQQPELFIQMAYMTLFTLPFMAVLLICAILSRKIKHEQKLIGTLSAFGYTNGQIYRYYAGFAAIPGLIGGLLTTICCYFAVQPFGELGLMDYEPLNVVFNLDFKTMLLGMIVPTLLYALAAVLTLRKLLKHNVAELLSGNVHNKVKIRKSLVKKNVSLRLKLCMRSIFGNFGRTCVLFFGVLFGGFVVLWSLGFLDTANNMITTIANNMGDYNYQYVLSDLKDENIWGGETILVGNLEDENEKAISIMGADGNSLLDLKDLDGQAIVIDDGYYITSILAYINDIEVGDEIKLYNPLSRDEYKLKVDGIIKNEFTKAIYTSRANISKLIGINEDLFNVIVSQEKLDIPDNMLVNVTSRDNIEYQYEAMLDQFNAIIYSFAIVGVLINLIAVYIAVNMSINENRRNISMLSVLGYDYKAIYKLLIRDNILIILPAIIISIPFASIVTDAMFISFIDMLGYRLESFIKPTTYIFAIILTILSYYVSVLIVSRKINKIDMVESLKENRD